MAENVDNNAVPVVGQDSVVSYECPNCGGPLHFGDGTTTSCDHCGTEVQRILPPIKMTSPAADDERKRSDEEDIQQTRPAGGGMVPLYYWFLFANIAHSNYTSQYTGTSATHPAHFHGVGGFAG